MINKSLYLIYSDKWLRQYIILYSEIFFSTINPTIMVCYKSMHTWTIPLITIAFQMFLQMFGKIAFVARMNVQLLISIKIYTRTRKNIFLWELSLFLSSSFGTEFSIWDIEFNKLLYLIQNNVKKIAIFNGAEYLPQQTKYYLRF